MLSPRSSNQNLHTTTTNTNTLQLPSQQMDFRIGRSPMRNQPYNALPPRSPVRSSISVNIPKYRRYSMAATGDYTSYEYMMVGSPTSSSSLNMRNAPVPTTNLRRLSNEQIIDIMEKEQDAIVLRLMREIAQLKEENKLLRQNQQRRPASRSMSTSSTTSTNKIPTVFNNTKFFNDPMFEDHLQSPYQQHIPSIQSQQILQKERSNSMMSVEDSSIPRSFESLDLDDTLRENRLLKEQIAELKLKLANRS